MKITFHGVRGSFPCSSAANARYGNNTSAVSVEVEGEPPLLLDLGTGLPRLAVHSDDGSFRATALVTHLHLDHVQGLPFFPPVHQPGTRLDVYGPVQVQGALSDAFGAFIRPPFFPLELAELRADLRFYEVLHDELSIGTAKIMVRPVPHNGPTVGYRVSWGGATIAYVSDHQAPPTLDRVAPEVLELCDGVDLLIHEAQYTSEEFAAKPDWGHCTVDYAVNVATEAGARRLVLFHHDPAHGDDFVDGLLEHARNVASRGGVEEVLAAHEGLTLAFDRPQPAGGRA